MDLLRSDKVKSMDRASLEILVLRFEQGALYALDREAIYYRESNPSLLEVMANKYYQVALKIYNSDTLLAKLPSNHPIHSIKDLSIADRIEYLKNCNTNDPLRHWYLASVEEAAFNLHAGACMLLADWYTTGHIISNVDLVKAHFWYSRLADNNYIPALLKLGELHLLDLGPLHQSGGEEMRIDVDKALEYFFKALQLDPDKVPDETIAKLYKYTLNEIKWTFDEFEKGLEELRQTFSQSGKDEIIARLEAQLTSNSNRLSPLCELKPTPQDSEELSFLRQEAHAYYIYFLTFYRGMLNVDNRTELLKTSINVAWNYPQQEKADPYLAIYIKAFFNLPKLKDGNSTDSYLQFFIWCQGKSRENPRMFKNPQDSVNEHHESGGTKLTHKHSKSF